MYSLRLSGVIEVGGQCPSQPQHRRLIAVLGSRRNRPIKTEDLIDVLWSGRPPASAHSTFYGLHSRVKPLIDATPGLSLDRLPHGYQLTVDAGACDLDAFERYATEFLLAGPGAPLEFGDRALELWRGVPFGDLVDDVVIDDEIQRLALLRDRVRAHRVEVLAHSRRWHETLAEAQVLLLAEPDNVALLTLLVRAQHGLQRYREALEQIDRIRRQLRRAGLELTGELRALEHRLLDETSGDSAVMSPTFEARVASGDRMFGRHTEIADVHDLLEHHPVVTIVGEGGLGKSTLAAAVAARYPDSMWCRLEAVGDVAELTEQMRDARGRAEHGPIVVVLDAAEHDDELVAVGVGQLTAPSSRGTPAPRVLVTSRVPIGFSAGVTYLLPPLDNDAAVELLCDRARLANASLAVNPNEAWRVAELLDGHPLTLELVAPLLGVHSPATVAERIEQGAGWSQATSMVNGRSLAGVVGGSYQSLSDAAQRLFRHLSVFEGGIGATLLRRLARQLDASVDPMTTVSELNRRSLLRVERGTEEIRYRMLAPIAEAGRRIAEAAAGADRSGAPSTTIEPLDMCRHRHVEVIVALCEEAARHAVGAAEARWAALITDELPNIRAARRACAASGWFDLQARLIAALWPEALLRDRLEVQRWATDIADHHALPLYPQRTTVWAIASLHSLLTGNLARAKDLGTRAVSSASDGAPTEWLAHNTLLLSAVLDTRGAVDDIALGHAHIMRTHPDGFAGAAGAFCLALVHVQAGRRLHSIPLAIELVRLSRRTPSQAVASMARFALGHARWDLNREAAVEHLRQSERLATAAGCRLMQLHALRALTGGGIDADLAAAQAQLAEAEENSPTERQLQHVADIAIILIQDGRLQDAALVCGALSRTLWSQTEMIRFATKFLRERLGPRAAERSFREGRAMNPEQLVAAVLNLQPTDAPIPNTAAAHHDEHRGTGGSGS